MNRGKESVAHVDREIELDSNWAPAHYHLGVALWLVENPNRSIPELDAAARVNIGFAYLQQAALDKAVAQLKGVIADHPALAIAHYNLGVALKQKDDLDAARKELARALELDPRLSEAHYTLGIIYW